MSVERDESTEEEVEREGGREGGREVRCSDCCIPMCADSTVNIPGTKNLWFFL